MGNVCATFGNVCVTREDSDQDIQRKCEEFVSLWEEIRARLEDKAGLAKECNEVYHAECQKKNCQMLTKHEWQVITTDFVRRISCEDNRTRDRIYWAIEGKYPGPADMRITTETFMEFTDVALEVAERDLRERIEKLQKKQKAMATAGPPRPVRPSPAEGGPNSPTYGDAAILPSTPGRTALGSSPPPGGSFHMGPSAGPSAGPSPDMATPAAARAAQPYQDRQWGRAPAAGTWAGDDAAFVEKKSGTGSRAPVGDFSEPRKWGNANPFGSPVTPGKLPYDDVKTPQQHANAPPPSPADLAAGGTAQGPHGQPYSTPGPPLRYSGAGAGATGPPAPPAMLQQMKMTENSLPATSTAPGTQLGVPIDITSPALPPQATPTMVGNSAVSPVTDSQGPVKGGSHSLPPQLSKEAVEETRRRILSGILRVYVYNKNIELEAKMLALNPSPHSRRISILREDGLCEDSWEMEHLRCITQGISPSILKRPPSHDLAVAFRFNFKDDGKQEDRFLCIVFDSAENAQLATEAFRQLCNVPVIPAY